MRRSYYIVLILLLISQISFGQVYQNMAQPGYKFARGRFDSVLTIPSGLGSLKNISGGRDTGQIRFNLSDSSVYVWNGRAWIKPVGGGGGDTTGIGDLYIRNTTTQENKRFNIKGGRLDSLYASTSAGGKVLSNSGTVAAEWGAGGGSNFNFHGFAGYNANRASSYTTRSFTDKNYVDSSLALKTTVTSYGKNAGGDSTILLLSDGTRYAAKDSVGGGGGGGGSYGDSTVPIWNRKGTVMTGYSVSEGMNNYEPSVIREGSPVILTSATKVFKMWYTSGWIGKNTNYAESLDGITWVKYASNPVVPNTSRSFVLKNGSTYVMYVSPNANNLTIDRYTSSDGVTWTLANAAVITSSANIYNTSVIIDGGTWRLLVDKYDGGSGYGQLYYTSPDGITWTIQNGGVPVLTGLGQGATFLKKIGSTFYVWEGETGGVATLPTDIYRYSSPDMITWTKNGTSPSFPRRETDEGPQTSLGQVQDVYLIDVDSSIYMFYAASRDGNDSAAGQKIKLAIANKTWEQLVSKNENDGANVIVQNDFDKAGLNDIYYTRGGVGIGGGVVNSKAVLDLQSTTKSFLPPRMTTAQMNAITSPPNGSVVYNTTVNALAFYNGSSWVVGSWSLTGNAGTNPSTNFFGTTDNQPLVFKSNNIVVGKLNTPIRQSNFGSDQTNITGSNNTNFGYFGMNAITSGQSNVSIGMEAAASLTTGSYNTIGGMQAGNAITSGNYNSAWGYTALSGSTGNYNVGIGSNSMKSRTGDQNVGIGQAAMLTGGSGGLNTAIGVNSGYSNTSGSNNVYLGAYAGYNNSTVGNQIFIDNQYRNNYSENQTQSPFYAQVTTNMATQKVALNGLVGINTITPTSTFQIAGSLSTPYTASGVNISATIAHNVIDLTATGLTATLPTAVGITGREYTIKLTEVGTGTVATTSSQTIDGSITYSLSAQYKYVTVKSTGANWIIIANN
jgi:hypothetical protein